jgi:hypothetical protein
MRFHLKGYLQDGQKFQLILFLIRAVLCNCLLPWGEGMSCLWTWQCLVISYVRKYKTFSILYFSVAQQLLLGRRPPHFEAPRSPTIWHAVELLWPSDQLVAKAVTYTTQNKRKRRSSMSWAAFESAVPTIKRQQVYALDFMANGIGLSVYSLLFCLLRSNISLWKWAMLFCSNRL